MTVQPPEQPLPRDLPCAHVVWDTTEGLCAICGAREIEVVYHWTPGGREVLRRLYGPPEREDRA